MAIIRVLRELLSRYFSFKVYDLSAQMAYYLLLSIFPFLIVIYSLLPYLPLSEDYIIELIRPFAPQGTYSLIEGTVSNILANQQMASLSLLISVWLSSMGVQCMKRIFNDIYAIEEKEPFLKQIVEGLLLTIGLMFAILFTVVIPVVERIMRQYLQDVHFMERFQGYWFVIQWGVGSVFILIFFIGLYYFAPNLILRVRQVLPGAIFSTIGWQVVSIIFSTVVSHNNYSAFYGQLGSIVILMLWFYFSAMIIITGGLLNTIIYPVTSSDRI
ncbi:MULTISPECIES: YihY/virulence factor BrkB family protein [Virgibacillus]|uniref:YihY family inner membrane protein n=2 Tax=Virgibacillus TaxID=84406 RepID=A0A024QDF2_9BACI|nr:MULTISPECIES: YihY/virulence factor BrkB family protein [Virgibacillus]EQB35295.1 hypothetical protein M948_19540 [Virgibacillus sp. CM-4]MYL42676.1 YihY family inner membrane protein [Virgibacillus massiliensis]GGJ75969.1 putative ribonuclease-like protein YfkH [Virgibacillus kapii]CDQ40563.1 ribonuclease BN/unknown domain fusion protein [Virgibacillus massiliensis]